MIYDQWMSDQKQNSNQRRKSGGRLIAALIFLAALGAFILLMGHLTNQDIEYHAEIVKKSLECECHQPAIEMTMPIEERVQA